MRIAIDNINDIKKIDKNNEIIFIFDKEPLEILLKTKIRCVNKKYINLIDFVDINLSKYEIECRKRTNINNKDWNVLSPIKENKIAIIIPNYNYGEWIDKCLSSIAKQKYKKYEVIFVDDMSTDDSVKIAYKYVEKLSNIKIIQLKQKRLNGGARNEAYLYLSDDVDYIWYIDSDDWIEEDSLEQINDRLQTNPDVLFIGTAKYDGKKTETDFIPQYKNKYEAMQGWSGSCGKVIKKELATRQECLYPEGTLKEDRTQHRKICIYMETFVNFKKPIYVWNRTNTNSVSTIRTKNILWETSTIKHYADTKELYLKQKGKDKEIDKILLKAVETTKQEMQKGGDMQW